MLRTCFLAVIALLATASASVVAQGAHQLAEPFFGDRIIEDWWRQLDFTTRLFRPRGLHLDEPEVTVDGRPVSAAILGTALTLFYPGRAQAGRGQGIYFYLPKVDGAEECVWYRDLFDRSRAQLPFLKDATIRAIPLVEALPADEGRSALVALDLATGRARRRPPSAAAARPRAPSSPEG